MSNRVPFGTMSNIAGKESSFENKFLPKQFLSVEQVFSFLIRPHPRQGLKGSPDEHLTGIYFHIVEGNFFRRPDGVIQLVDYGRIYSRVKTCGFSNDLKKEIRYACKQRGWERLYKCGVFTHPSFKECFRLKIGNRLISHLESMNSVHALYLAFSVSCTSKVLAVSLSHSYGTFRGIRQSEIFPMTLLFLYYQKHLKGISDEKSVIKKIKVSLCTEFSIHADQELPEGFENSFRIFPKSMQTTLDTHLRDRKSKLAFYFSILQGKSLCYEVSEQFVQETLEKHRKTLCEGETRKLQPEFCAELVEQGKRLGLYLRDHYNPFLTNKAPISASYSYSRKRGGVLGELIDSDKVFIGSNHLENDPQDRCEPLVIGLFGEPACGKSTLVQKLISELQRELFPFVNLQNVSYSRSCSMKHWDGYTGQPIVVLDDFGQSSDRYDTIEFQQLISCNPYQLPMAELEDKGQMFTSPIVILTSNMTYGHALSTASSPEPIEDNLAFWRRIHIPLLLGNSRKMGRREIHTNDKIVFTEALRDSFTEDELKGFQWSKMDPELTGHVSDPFCSSQYSSQMNTTVPVGRTRRASSDSVDYYCTKRFPRKSLLRLVIRQSLNFRDHFFQHTSKYWNQIVSSEQVQKIQYESGIEANNVVPLCGENQTISYRFPRHPPQNILPVRVEPIKEPLKCRTITAGEADTRCLKPLQQCMWDYLGTQKQFRLTHGTKFLERSVWNCRSIEQPDPKLQEVLDDLSRGNKDSKVWVSGDYSAATDNFILDCGAMILKNALSYIDHEPTKEWAMKEMSSHLLVYPESSGLKPGIQRNGQLMGSLLSFPLLCMVNDSTARLAGAKQEEYLINGDDILMRVEPEVGDRWRQIAPSLGLELSIGKTFVDPDFGTVNSQLFYNGELVPTGKIKTASRRCQILGETFRDFIRFHSDRQAPEQLAKLYLQWNRPSLMKTFESLKVPVSHGGLGLFPMEEDKPVRLEQDLLVYLTKMRKKLRYRKGVLKFPFIGLNNIQVSARGQELLDRPEDYDHEEGVVSQEMLETSKKIDSTPVLRKLRQSIKSQSYSLMSLPDLDFIQFKEMKSSAGEATQIRIMNRFMNTLFDEDITQTLDAQELLKLFRTKKENSILDSLGVIMTPKKEEGYSSLLDNELVPVLMCPERFWKDYFNSAQHLESLSDLEMPEKNQVFSRNVPWSQISDEDLDIVVDFSKEITEFDVSPLVHSYVPDFEVPDSQDLKSLLVPQEDQEDSKDPELFKQ